MLRLGNITLSRGGALRRCSTTPPPLYCGIDLHARTLDVGSLDPSGEGLGQRHLTTTPEALLPPLAPYRPGLVVAVEWRFPGDWLAALWADDGVPFGLGPALSLQAIPGGKATNDQRAAHTMAARLRGGMLPPASGSPAPLRAPRDLRRRRRPRAHNRAARLAPVQHPTSQ